MLNLAGKAFEWVMRLVPAAALFSLLFALDGNLRWLGLLGIVPLLLQRAGCSACAMRHTGQDPSRLGWPTFPGH
jgi:hypothetical protein